MIDLLSRLRGVRRSGRDRWQARCPAHDDRSPSLSVAHRDGKWLLFCHAGCSIGAIIAALGLPVSDLFDEAHARRRIIRDAPIRSISLDAVDTADIKRRLEKARHIWRASRRPELGRLDAYLASRGLTRPLTGHLRFHPNLWHPKSGRSWPAMVWLVTDAASGKPIGIHVTFLDDAGPSKAPISPSKVTFGLIRGGVIRLTPPPPPDSGEPLVIGEGIETALSAVAARSAHAWAAISSGNMKVIELPQDIRAVIIIADMDDARGMAAARFLAQPLSRQGRDVRIAQPPQGLDLNDLLRAGKDDEEAAA
jgi:hypothetical protein